MMKTIQDIAQRIGNIRYHDSEKIAFDCDGKTYLIADPADVVLVGVGFPAQVWLAKHYGYLIG